MSNATAILSQGGSLVGKVALVTGGATGIGAATCRELAAQGAFVYINYNSSSTAASALADAIRASGGAAVAIHASVRDQAQVEAMFQDIRAGTTRHLDILVNNAGVMRDQLLGMTTLDDWADVLATNLTGTFLCSRYAVRLMMARRSGSIVNVSSVAGVSGRSGQCSYSASKGAILAFTRTLAAEVGSFNIRVNAVAPGAIDTTMFTSVPQEARRQILSACPLGRLGKPEEVARVIAFLASDSASYIHGQTLIVDGGLIRQ